ncbi:MAG: hypothetical protein BJBARM5_0236 [Candidatus Parvarchaeum acidophilus ARMAN-5]|jgi:hypothetical protein|uniref:Uncharacterized protein n=1 Tax=Candidatus Parvarchaeum acidophilus ARMAN-5 TaxID=662762 RepID=D6GUT9_PARA5|nr:MAG: hypothetical protein BJBARM5_0236 [Candidatus Parvarchaeum acidophilus ARMAN-5]
METKNKLEDVLSVEERKRKAKKLSNAGLDLIFGGFSALGSSYILSLFYDADKILGTYVASGLAVSAVALIFAGSHLNHKANEYYDNSFNGYVKKSYKNE